MLGPRNGYSGLTGLVCTVPEPLPSIGGADARGGKRSGVVADFAEGGLASLRLGSANR